jgi:HD-GYP domain-containing protein (c-di-GMP phosphodiesterase class II)
MRLFDMVGCLSSAMDLVSPEVAGHHIRVGAIASKLGETAGLPGQVCADLALAGMLHDMGAFSLKGRLSTLAFEAGDRTHPEIGYRLLCGYPGFARAAELVRLHHVSWNPGCQPKKVFWPDIELGNLLCLADRVEALMPRDAQAGLDREAILARIHSGAGSMFNPWWVEALEILAKPGGFLEEAAALDSGLLRLVIPKEYNPELSGREVSGLARLFSQIIDFRCRFTSTHSRGVAAIAMTLAHELHLPGDERDLLEVASELHDLGKLGVPSEIIMKPSALDPTEMAVMRLHAEHGYNALAGAPALADVAELVGQHHERLDGSGYPFALKGENIGLASRILAVADVFTAMGEDRPYRAGIELRMVVDTIWNMAKRKFLDTNVAGLIVSRREHMDEVRREAQAQALSDFENFASGLAS